MVMLSKDPMEAAALHDSLAWDLPPHPCLAGPMTTLTAPWLMADVWWWWVAVGCGFRRAGGVEQPSGAAEPGGGGQGGEVDGAHGEAGGSHSSGAQVGRQTHRQAGGRQRLLAPPHPMRALSNHPKYRLRRMEAPPPPLLLIMVVRAPLAPPLHP